MMLCLGMIPIDSKTGRFISTPPIQRFWDRVEKTSTCWIWKGIILTTGYGQIGFRDNHHQSAHRFSYELHHGKIAKGMCVCHSCDNKKCVNPKHLWLGTSAQNTADREKKGRGVRGEKSHSHKLTEKQVKKIRSIYVKRYGEFVRIAKLFKVDK